MDARSTPARETYDRLAPVYDRFTSDYDYDTWLTRLEEVADHHGRRGSRLLDIACGTGRSFAPMLARGYEVTACDVSPGMAAVARQRAGDCARVFVADMRALPDCGAFDVVTCLDDAVNYLLTRRDLIDMFRCAAARLAPGGLLIFDTNTTLTYRSAFATSDEFDVGDTRFRWEGTARLRFAPGGLATARVTAEEAGRRIADAIHLQRHHPPEVVCAALRAAGLTPGAVLGQSTGCRISRRADDLTHTKSLFVARRDEEPCPKRRGGLE